MRTATEDELTVDELARRTGTTVRNIRAYQSRGLLPPPEVRARTGYYGPEHVARLELIREMQADGFNLKSIKRLLDRSRGAGEDVLGFKREVMAPFGEERPEVLNGAELTGRLGGDFDPKAVRKAEKLGVLVSLGEDRYEVPSPTLLRAWEEVAALGVSVDAALSVLEQIHRSSRRSADAFVRLFLDEVVKPMQASERPEERWSKVREALERTRPLASQVLLADFELTMTRAVERAFGRELER